MWGRHLLVATALLTSVVLGYPSFYLSYQGCIEPYVGMTLMGRPLTMNTDGTFTVSPSARIQAGVSVVLTITVPADGQFLLYVSGATGSIISPWSAAGTCTQLSWTTTSARGATATITPSTTGTLTVRALYAPTYGPVQMTNFSVVLGGDSSGCTDLTQSNGSPWYDTGGAGYSCSQYYAQTGRCASDGGSYQNFGMTANSACCVCGGGSRARTCSDLTLANSVAWYDSGGPNYNCVYYSQAGKCAAEGTSYANGGYNAAQACCTCGGGTGGGGGRGSLAPTISPTRSPTVLGRCTDLPLRAGTAWYDSGGPNYGCTYYAQGSKCTTEGNSYANNGLTAAQACCACGGGSTGGTRGSLSPTSSPTFAPTVGACQDIPFPNGQPWYDSGGASYTCSAHYKTTAICSAEGSSYSNQGMNGNVACCACGGGTTGNVCWVGTSVTNLCASGSSCATSTGLTTSATPTLGTCSRGTDYTGTACWIGYNIPASASCPSGYTCNPLYATTSTGVTPGTCVSTSTSVIGTQGYGGVCVQGGVYSTTPIYNCMSGLTCVITTPASYQPAVGTCQYSSTTTSPPTAPPTSSPLPCYPGYTVCPNSGTCISGYCVTPGSGQTGAVCYLGVGAPQICASGLTCILANALTGTGTCQTSTTGVSGGLGSDCTTTLACNSGLTCYLQTSTIYSTVRICQFTGTGQSCSTNADCGTNLACVPTGTYNPPATCQPTTSVTTGGCKDMVLPGSTITPWHDAYAVANTCANQYTKSGMCQSLGNAYAFQGLTANMACCVCGGGVKTA